MIKLKSGILAGAALLTLFSTNPVYYSEVSGKIDKLVGSLVQSYESRKTNAKAKLWPF